MIIPFGHSTPCPGLQIRRGFSSPCDPTALKGANSYCVPGSRLDTYPYHCLWMLTTLGSGSLPDSN